MCPALLGFDSQQGSHFSSSAGKGNCRAKAASCSGAFSQGLKRPEREAEKYTAIVSRFRVRGAIPQFLHTSLWLGFSLNTKSILLHFCFCVSGSEQQMMLSNRVVSYLYRSVTHFNDTQYDGDC